jgi:hypothetical protein
MHLGLRPRTRAWKNKNAKTKMQKRGRSGIGACRVRIPAESAVVLAAGEEHRVVMRAPGEPQDAPGMTQESLPIIQYEGRTKLSLSNLDYASLYFLVPRTRCGKRVQTRFGNRNQRHIRFQSILPPWQASAHSADPTSAGWAWCRRPKPQ